MDCLSAHAQTQRSENWLQLDYQSQAVGQMFMVRTEIIFDSMELFYFRRTQTQLQSQVLENITVDKIIIALRMSKG